MPVLELEHPDLYVLVGLSFLWRPALAQPLTTAQLERARSALQAMNDGAYAVAAQLLDELGNVTLSRPDLSRAAGFAHLSLDHLQRGVDYLRASLALDDSQPEVHMAIGDVLTKVGDANTALRHLQNAIALNPGAMRAHYLEGLALLRLGRTVEALDSMRRALSQASDFRPARLGVVRILTDLERLEEAEEELSSFMQSGPADSTCKFRLAKIREKQLRYDEAAELLESAARENDALPEVCEALGLIEIARGNPAAAIAAFERGLDDDPANTDLLAHHALLRYELGDSDAFVAYEKAATQTNSPPAVADYVLRLIQSKDFVAAEERLEDYATRFGKDILWAQRKAQLFNEQGKFDASKALLADAPIDHLTLMALMAQAQIGLGEYEEAETLIMSLLQRDRRDQFLLAMLSTCYRATKPELYATLVDYDVLVRRSELAVPKGFGSLYDFNQALLETLERLHITQVNPLAQSVVDGTQTPGNLLLQPDPVIQSLREAIYTTLERELNEAFFATVKDNNPVNVARGKPLDLQAAWSIWVTEGGYHKSHVHNRGWYSSAYYVSLPDEILPQNAIDHAGALAFGRPGVATPEDFAPDRILAPEEGILTLFPSFVWHETLPYRSEAPRVVVAFDAVPKMS